METFIWSTEIMDLKSYLLVLFVANLIVVISALPHVPKEENQMNIPMSHVNYSTDAADLGIMSQVTDLISLLQTESNLATEEEMRMKHEREKLDAFLNHFKQLLVSSRPRYG